MVIVAFRCLCAQLIVISCIIVACAGLSWLADGRQGAVDLLQTTVVQMKGPWVWTFGWGLAAFVGSRGRLLPAALDGILVASEATALAVARIEQSTLHRKAWHYTLPITSVGVFLTLMYGIPNTGLAHWLIFVGVCAIYYIAAFLLFHFVGIIQAFNALVEAIATVEFKRVYSPLHLETITNYLALTTMLGLIAIYAGFRGTLTAGFKFQDEVWRIFLVTPLVLFLPGTLFYNYFPRYVLRKLVQYKVLKTMERLGTADDYEARSLVLDLRENAAINAQILPFVDYKTAPSYLLAIFFGVSIAYNNDPAVKAFLEHVLSIGSR